MKKNVQVVEKSKIWFAFSLILIAISIGSLFINGLNFGIDFIGGTIVTIELNTPFETSDAKALIEEFDSSADVTYAGEAKTQVIISTKKDLSTEELVAQRMDKYSKMGEYKE